MSDQVPLVSQSPLSSPRRERKKAKKGKRDSNEDPVTTPGATTYGTVILPDSNSLRDVDTREFQYDALLRHSVITDSTVWNLDNSLVPVVESSHKIRRHMEHRMETEAENNFMYCPPAAFIKGASNVTGLFSVLKVKVAVKQHSHGAIGTPTRAVGMLVFHYCNNQKIIDRTCEQPGVRMDLAPKTKTGRTAYILPFPVLPMKERSTFAKRMVAMLLDGENPWSEHVHGCGFVEDTLSRMDKGTLAILNWTVDFSTCIYVEVEVDRTEPKGGEDGGGKMGVSFSTGLTESLEAISFAVHLHWTNALTLAGERFPFMLIVLVGKRRDFCQRVAFTIECTPMMPWKKTKPIYSCPFLNLPDFEDDDTEDRKAHALKLSRRMLIPFWKRKYKAGEEPTSQLMSIMAQCQLGLHTTMK